MVIVYNLVHVPSTKSDGSDQGGEHYRLKKIFIDWLREEQRELLKNFVYVIYDERMITFEEFELGYEPDAAIVRQKSGQVWIEIETDPLNVFRKLTVLMYLSKFGVRNLPVTLLFGIPPLSHLEQYTETFRELKKLNPVEDVRACVIHTPQKIVKLSWT